MTTSDIVRLLIYALATYRLTRLISTEDGPWDIFTRLRASLGVVTQQDPQGEWVTWSDRLLGKLVACPYCLSGWVAIVATALWLADYSVVDLIALWLAIWAVATALLSQDRNI